MNLLTSEDLYQRFGHTLSFVATRSGLMRWRDFPDSEKKTSSEPPPDHFSRIHPRAIDEIWYKRAVEQYYVQPESLVFSIPIDEDGATNSTLVTVSSAIFVGNDDSIKAPAAVVGFQMTHMALQGFFQNNTLPCANNTNTDCFLVDNHAYIIAAKEASKAGRFLGDVNGLVMSSLVEHNVFEKITVFDYQAVCFRDTQESNDGNILLTPLKTVAMAASWLYGQMAFSLAKAGFWSYDYAEAVAYPNDDVEIELDKVTIAEEPPIEPESMNDNVNKPAAEIKDDGIYDNLIRIKRTRPEPCDQKVDLYLLRGVTEANAVHDDPNTGITGCDHLKYIVQPVNLTNMILLIIDTQGCQNVLFKMSTDPQELAYTQNSSLACQKTSQNLPRRRPQTCIRNHSKESEIKDLCGRAATGSRLDLRLLGLVALAVILGVTGH